MNLYVDDVRECPIGWDIARDYTSAKILLKIHDYDRISLDHDIASYGIDGKEYTGYDILCHLEELHAFGHKIPHISIHTANAAVWKKMNDVAQNLNARSRSQVISRGS